MSLEHMVRLLRDAEKLVKDALKAMERFEESLIEGSIVDTLESLERVMNDITVRYPAAGPYRDRVELLKRYVAAMRVRIVVHGVKLRGFFREASYIESHLREVLAFIETLLRSLASPQHGAGEAREVYGRFRAHPVV